MSSPESPPSHPLLARSLAPLQERARVSNQNLRRLLDRMEIGPGHNLYVHTSMSFLRHLELSPAEIVDQLLAQVAPGGTIAMPSFPWNREKGQRLWYNYEFTFHNCPDFRYDDPCNVGLIAETFRQHPKTRRSLDYFYPICAQGPLTEELTRSCLHEPIDHDPQGDSGFARLHKSGFSIMGLGVTANTTSLSFLADVALGPQHRQTFLSSELRIGHIIDEQGRRQAHPGYWLLPQAVKGVRPREVIDRSHNLGGAYCEVKVGETIHFHYPYAAFHEQALILGRQALAAGESVPWLCLPA